MITKNLFEEVLVEPVKGGGDTLYVVSGYATAAMAFHHIETIRRSLRKDIRINLIVGMCPYDGLSLSNHKAFQQLASVDFPDFFECSYVVNSPPVHTKLYSWFQGERPICGFIGSANYTQNAFSGNQRELLAEYDPNLAIKYFEDLIVDTIYCTHHEIENHIEICRDAYYARRKKEQLQKRGLQLVATERPDLQDLPAIRVSLLDNTGNLPKRSGLNWGQRPEEGREPNQAYIRLPFTIYRSDFFPPVTVHFTVLTDDNKILICTRAQQNGKAIHTPHNNSLIGEYFRHRLGISSGHPVTKTNLIRYGRAEIDFYKIDDETYFMDFSVSAPHG
ncbi:MAG: restriction endonuclease [candidate division Zixibacteria bacterium CG_4_9_14_3_um_filter_46_8]|nr:MAG: restriction endonuclease [candidate division Zixibacteria bacterium CG_4_9_14_3_um_filter_46_8]